MRVKQFDRLIGAVGLLRREGWDWPLEIYGRSDPPVDPGHDGELARMAAWDAGGVCAGIVGIGRRRCGGRHLCSSGRSRGVWDRSPRSLCAGLPCGRSAGEHLAGSGGELRAADGVVSATSTSPEGLAAAMREAHGVGGDAEGRWRRRREVAQRVSVEECVCQLSRLYRSLTGTNRCFRNSSKP